jgi:antitoxin VapB
VSLYIRDDRVDALAREYQRISGAPTKSKAVQAALELAIGEARKTQSYRQVAARALAIMEALGPSDPDFDLKAYTDNL